MLPLRTWFPDSMGSPADRIIDAARHLSNPIPAVETRWFGSTFGEESSSALSVHRLARRGHMSNYDDGSSGVQDAPLARDSGGDTARYGGAPQGTPQQMPPYGYQQQWVMRPKRVYPIETKPFFLTSEFVGSVLAILGIAITAAVLGRLRRLARLDPDHRDRGRLHDQPRDRQVGDPLARGRSARALRPAVGSRPASARAGEIGGRWCGARRGLAPAHATFIGVSLAFHSNWRLLPPGGSQKQQVLGLAARATRSSQ